MTKSWSILRDHIYYNMCDEDDNKFNWFMTWMAHIVQKPDEKYGMAVAINGVEGCGKSSLINYFTHILDCRERALYYNSFCDPVFTTFPLLDNKTNLVILDEWDQECHEANEDTLKNLISDDFFVVERKGEDAEFCKNSMRFVLLTQDNFINGGDRRFAKFHMKDTHKYDTNFFADVWDQMKVGGGQEAFEEELENWVPPQEDGWDCLRRAPEEAEPYAIFDLETRGIEDNVSYATGGVLKPMVLFDYQKKGLDEYIMKTLEYKNEEISKAILDVGSATRTGLPEIKWRKIEKSSISPWNRCNGLSKERFTFPDKIVWIDPVWTPKNDGWRNSIPWNITTEKPSSNTYGPDNWTAQELIHCVDMNGTAYLAEQNNWSESDVMSWYGDATNNRGE